MFWFFVLLLIFTFAFNRLTLKYGLKGISYNRTISKEMVEINEPFEMIMVIENKKFLPVSFLQITEKFPFNLNCKFINNYKDDFKDVNKKQFINFTTTMFILPYQKIRRIYTISGDKRGRHIFRNSNLKIGDFVGLKNVNKSIDGFQELVILPKKLNLDETLIPYGNYQGDISVRRWIIDDPLMTIGIREYTGNEPEKHIHWPSSLKYGNLMVKNFDFTTDNKVNIILNVESAKPFWRELKEDDIETCISLCRGMIEELEEFQIPYNLITNSRSKYNATENFNTREAEQYDNVLKALGKIVYGIAVPFEELINNILKSRKSFTTFVIITPKIFESYIKPIEKLEKNNNKIILISLEKDNLNNLNSSIIKYVREIV